MVTSEYRVIGLTGIGEVRPGDDLVAMLLDATYAQGTAIRSGDVLVVTQKIVSKAESRLVKLADVEPSAFARSIAATYDKEPALAELILRESRRIVKMDNGVIITETHLGLICANAGIDTSNLHDTGYVALLPEEPDRWCQVARGDARRRNGSEIAVIMSDTFGRPWREGCTNVAIGVAGMSSMVDYRGQEDSAGVVLRVTQMAVADELAAAAELVMGKFDRVPAALVRGFPYPQGEGSALELVRDPGKDLFR